MTSGPAAAELFTPGDVVLLDGVRGVVLEAGTRALSTLCEHGGRSYGAPLRQEVEFPEGRPRVELTPGDGCRPGVEPGTGSPGGTSAAGQEGDVKASLIWDSGWWQPREPEYSEQWQRVGVRFVSVFGERIVWIGELPVLYGKRDEAVREIMQRWEEAKLLAAAIVAGVNGKEETDAKTRGRAHSP